MGFSFDFTNGTQACTAAFADYPPGQEGFLELVAEHRTLPAPLAPGGGFFLSGNNHTDDLFMFIACPLNGLRSGTDYRMTLDVEFATNVPRGCGGVGGSPGESVYMKAGATGEMPRVVNDAGRYRTSFDKGNQAVGGTAMNVIGTIENSRPCDLSALVWERKTLRLADTTSQSASPPGATVSGSLSSTAGIDPRAQFATVRPSASGTIWVLAGTDSGFEARTSFYFLSLRGDLAPR